MPKNDKTSLGLFQNLTGAKVLLVHWRQTGYYTNKQIGKKNIRDSILQFSAYLFYKTNHFTNQRQLIFLKWRQDLVEHEKIKIEKAGIA